MKVAPGYKAEIIETLKDHTPDGTTDYDFYINRTKFVPNLTLGKDATFTMPANTDATVIIRYTKGYDLTLELKDTSKLAAPGNLNAADVDTAESPARTLHAESDGTTTTDSDGPLTGVRGQHQDHHHRHRRHGCPVPCLPPLSLHRDSAGGRADTGDHAGRSARACCSSL